MDKRYDVLVVGELNVDLILNGIQGFPSVGKEIIANDMALALGSSSAIFASNISTLGSSVNFLGMIGRDSFGELVLSALRERGVHTDDILYADKSRTGCTVVLSYLDDRANVTFPGAMEELSVEDVDDEMLDSTRHLHISSIFLQRRLKDGLLSLLRRAKAKGLTVSIDPQWDPAEKWDVDLRDLLTCVDLFLPNAEELMAMTGAATTDAAVKEIRGHDTIVVVKQGNAGAALYGKDMEIVQQAFSHTAVVDTVGAGDSFNAGFIHYYLQGRPFADCLRMGCLAGAVNTTSKGGTAAFSTLEDFQQAANFLFNNTLQDVAQG
ncbi:MAG: hypothetical protein BGO55_04575 [Sphingobacteriales bacterium 50-39]|nr:carbohydrate kinase family protein [Sphingobacteriales bacterium]OJW55896.1 MAG: hypothetical protein BGO55_04575 [Sphingobacteriales bacterium 50-39]